MKNKWIYFIIGILLVAVFGYGFNIDIFKQSITSQPDTKKLQVATSFYPLYYFAIEVGKDRAKVINITPVGSESHDYEPTAQDVAIITNSKLLILNGTGFEPWYEKIKRDIVQKNIKVIETTQGLNLMEGEVEDEEKEEEREDRNSKDPHVWLSPVLAGRQIEKIKDAFIEVDSQNKDYYSINAKDLQDRLIKLDKKYRDGLKECKQKNIVTSHIAFAYLAKEYGLNQVAISGLSPDEEPSAQQLTEVTKFAKENNVKYIFFESLVSPKLSETIANEVGAKTLVLDPIEGLSDDDIKQGKNYFTVMEDNLKNLKTALQCSK